MAPNYGSSKIFIIIKLKKRMQNDKKAPLLVITRPKTKFYDNKTLLHDHNYT